jgi:hypothetical protein
VKKFLCLFAVAVLLASQPLPACTVFFAFDGKLAIAGDNEDLDHPYTQMWTIPSTRSTYGVVYFGFGRGQYPTGGVFLTDRARQAMSGSIPLDQLKAEDTYGIPQQGMNEKGLFCGGAETEIVSEDSSHAGLPRYDGIVTDLILRKAANVRDALQLLESHDYWMREGQLLCADRSGESFILEAGKVVLRGTGRYQVITNFLQSRNSADKNSDRRYKIVDGRLSQGPKLSADLVRSLLHDTQQGITQYSTVFDLTNLDLQIYQRRDFSKAVTIRLPDELAKGPRAAEIRALFE